ncbi:Arp2/3 complex, 34 kd subunit p34-Arc-domain-containing protein [Rhizophagus diaphanus]|nr:Arp2/3 complex, 34 kd subunit p34-Arc-domain-containing protein [Rhizophagus diaphanus] [Rhizophagus sp. MUCL 43196]
MKILIEYFDKVFLRMLMHVVVHLFKMPHKYYTQAKEPPLEIRRLQNTSENEDIGYFTFVLLPRHFAKEREEIQLFRDYLHYHIKCSKAICTLECVLVQARKKQ